MKLRNLYHVKNCKPCSCKITDPRGPHQGPKAGTLDATLGPPCPPLHLQLLLGGAGKSERP